MYRKGDSPLFSNDGDGKKIKKGTVPFSPKLTSIIFL
jgi:hypothetical protein